MPGLLYVSAASAGALAEEYAQAGYVVHNLDLAGVTGREALFERVAASLPCGDCSPGSRRSWRWPANWDAMNDFLFQGLADDDVRRHVLVLAHAQQLAAENLPVLLDALLALDDLSAALLQSRAGPLELQICVLGEGKGFAA